MDERRNVSTSEVVSVPDAEEHRDAEKHDEMVDPEAEQRPEPQTQDRTPDDGDLAAGRPLFQDDEMEEFRRRWSGIQGSFVDEPKRTVEEADGLVNDVLERLAVSFARERQGLERQWGRGEDASTEDLRRILQRYRSFFERLLAA